MGKEPAWNAGDTRDVGSIPVSGRSPGGGHSNPVQYSCLENPMDRWAWRATVHRSQRGRHDSSNWAWAGIGQAHSMCDIRPTVYMTWIANKRHSTVCMCVYRHHTYIWCSYNLWYYLCHNVYSVQFSRSVVSDSLQPHEPQHTRPPCSSPTSGVHPNPSPLSWWCHPNILSSVVPFSSCPQSFPASGSFPMNQLFASGGQSIGVSASTSVLPMNTQDWSPLGWTGWISLQSMGLSITYSYNISYVQLNKINPFSLETPILQAVPGHCPPLPQAGISHAQGDADTPSLIPQSSSPVMLPQQRTHTSNPCTICGVPAACQDFARGGDLPWGLSRSIRSSSSCPQMCIHSCLHSLNYFNEQVSI